MLMRNGEPSESEAITAVLDRQTVCWNNGDIDCFMTGYWRSDSLKFVGSSGVTYGWQNTLDRYKQRYPNLETMGKLRFDIIELNPIATDVYTVVGKFHLSRTIGDLSGYFTLVFQRKDNQWVIVMDHTSSSP